MGSRSIEGLDWWGSLGETWYQFLDLIQYCRFGVFCGTEYIYCGWKYYRICETQVSIPQSELRRHRISGVLQRSCLQWFQHTSPVFASWQGICCIHCPRFFSWPLISQIIPSFYSLLIYTSLALQGPKRVARQELSCMEQGEDLLWECSNWSCPGLLSSICQGHGIFS